MVDLVKGKAIMFDKDSKGSQFWEEEIPADLMDLYEEKRLEMMEAVAEEDEAMMEKYLEEGTLSEEDLHYCIRKATIAQTIVPVLCGTAFRNVGVQPLLDAIVEYLPSPLDIAQMKGTPPTTRLLWPASCSSWPPTPTSVTSPSSACTPAMWNPACPC